MLDLSNKYLFIPSKATLKKGTALPDQITVRVRPVNLAIGMGACVQPEMHIIHLWLQNGPPDWLLVDNNMVDFSGAQCNKIGTSYTAFRSQQGKCYGHLQSYVYIIYNHSPHQYMPTCIHPHINMHAPTHHMHTHITCALTHHMHIHTSHARTHISHAHTHTSHITCTHTSHAHLHNACTYPHNTPYARTHISHAHPHIPCRCLDSQLLDLWTEDNVSSVLAFPICK